MYNLNWSKTTLTYLNENTQKVLNNIRSKTKTLTDAEDVLSELRLDLLRTADYNPQASDMALSDYIFMRANYCIRRYYRDCCDETTLHGEDGTNIVDLIGLEDVEPRVSLVEKLEEHRFNRYVFGIDLYKYFYLKLVSLDSGVALTKKLSNLFESELQPSPEDMDEIIPIFHELLMCASADKIMETLKQYYVYDAERINNVVQCVLAS